ncbi:uncharacterized protein LOC117223669 isoform X1 [Megalopta genalis]|uniref:uncharacterized protein LOC117223669 isoform X1 n=1 Tax=Megalopta genalis TaxID=115081 RepID=UPI003FD3327C
MKVSQTHVGEAGNGTNSCCRLCLREKVYSRPLFAEGTATERLRSRILDCCPITLFDDDRLPSSICDLCENKLDIVYQFRQLCRESERVLRARFVSSFRERSDTIRVGGAQTCVDKRTKISEARPVSCEIVRDNSEVIEETGTGKRAEPLGFQSEEEEEAESVRHQLESESGTPIAKQRKNKELEEEDHSSQSRTTTEAAKTSSCAGSGERGEKKYLCDLCSKTFASKSGLRFHLKSHVGEKPHPCRHCGKRFAIPSYAKRHERIHTAEKQFVCHVCSAAFASSNGLRYHLRSHTGEANYRCETCDKSFGRYKYLKEHVFTHTGEKPFACKSCGAAYANSGSLFVHEKKCRNKSGVDRPGEPTG